MVRRISRGLAGGPDKGYKGLLLALVTAAIFGCGGNSEEGEGGAAGANPTASPSPSPTPAVQATPSPEPSTAPTATPTPIPSTPIPSTPTPSPNVEPTTEPTTEPTAAPLLPDTTADPALPSPTEADYVAAQQAARFLTQATFGPTAKSLRAFMATTPEQWLTAQFNLPQTYHLPLLDQWVVDDLKLTPAPIPEVDDEGWYRDLIRSDVWWACAVWGEDQLRQKVAYALSQILVISNVSDVLFNDARGVANYHDILAEHAFGNYRDLLQAITLNPMMGEYLSMIRNEKANQARNIRPDENYARELMQLFSIGLLELNIDGSVKLDGNGQTIATYTQDDIKALARVFTGWNMSTVETWWQWVSWGEAEVTPMKVFPEYHDTEAKTLFGTGVIPAKQSALQDIESALDIIFAHPNVGPFISQQLIQRLVTSNPSPAYVQRVAEVFNNNGEGVKGDMKQVVRAILLDDEARNGHLEQPNTFGKIREPLLKVAGFWRAFKTQGITVDQANGQLSKNRLRFRGSDRELGQRPYGAFSVFNFYRPDYQHPGEIKTANLNAPEMQILTESQIIRATNNIGSNSFWADSKEAWLSTYLVQKNWDVSTSAMYFEDEKAMAGNPEQLLNKINLLLFSGNMSQEMYTLLLNHMNAMPQTEGFAWKFLLYEVLYIATASPEFAVQR